MTFHGIDYFWHCESDKHLGDLDTTFLDIELKKKKKKLRLKIPLFLTYREEINYGR